MWIDHNNCMAIYIVLGVNDLIQQEKTILKNSKIVIVAVFLSALSFSVLLLHLQPLLLIKSL